MTVSPDARTPSATIHALSGSPQPGNARTMQPFGIATAFALDAARLLDRHEVPAAALFQTASAA